MSRKTSVTRSSTHEPTLDARSFLIAVTWNESAISAQFRALAHGLQARGHTVQIVTDGRRPVADGDDGVGHVAAWPSARPTGVADARFLDDLIRRRRVDTVIANFGAVNVCLTTAWARRVPRRIAWYHTLSTQLALDTADGWRTELRRRRKRAVYGLATDVVANSHAAARDAVEAFGITRSKLRVVHYALADPGRPEASIDHEGVVCAARMDRSKGQDVLIRALARLPHLRATFLGDGPERGTLEALAESLGVSDRCAFEGSVPRADVLAAMARAQVTVVPSRFEAFGLVAVESLAAGTPVAATDNGGPAEIVRPGLDGWLVPPDDPEALAEAITRCIAGGRTMRDQARQRFEDAFELDAWVDDVCEWLLAPVGSVAS